MGKLSTKHVVLGLMIDRPGYGYGLQQQFAERLGFLQLAESSIYKTIERLEADGWVEAVVPHDVWANHLSPRGNSGGILCITCMAARAAEAGLRNVPCLLAAGPFVPAPADNSAWMHGTALAAGARSHIGRQQQQQQGNKAQQAGGASRTTAGKSHGQAGGQSHKNQHR